MRLRAKSARRRILIACAASTSMLAAGLAGSAAAATPTEAQHAVKSAGGRAQMPRVTRGAQLIGGPVMPTAVAARGGPMNCGNSVLDSGEQCDDGNAVGGDGCSATCQVEDGFVCTDPVPGSANIIADPSFEAGTPNPSWTEASTNFGTPLCDPNTCNPAFTASDGNWFAWFGGIAAFEQASLEQMLTIPAGATTLEFDLHVHTCDSASDFLEVRIDGSTVFTTVPCVTGGGYSRESVDVGAFDDGGNHTLLVESFSIASNDGLSNFFLDNLSLAAAGQPSLCVPVGSDTCFSEHFDAGAPTLDDWFRFNNGELDWDWGTTDDGVCGFGPFGTPGNHTGGAAEAACIDSDAAGPGIVNAYLCSPQFTVGSATSELNLKYNYQSIGVIPWNAFQILIGTETPSLATIGGYTELMFTIDSQGNDGAPPGAVANLAIGDFSGQVAHVCIRYGDYNDQYAQVDDIVVSGCGVPTDSDDDGLADNDDNCILAPNGPAIPDAGSNVQLDSDGDGFGNACDADIFPPGGGDCVVNFGDLSQLKSAFVPNPYQALADFNGDGLVNFGDLAFMKSTFFNGANPGPGPSGVPNICN